MLDFFAGHLSLRTDTHRACVQTIKTWYKLMPDALGKKLAAKRGLGVKMPEKERQKREQQTEEEYLRKEGYSEEQVGSRCLLCASLPSLDSTGRAHVC